MNDHSMTDTPNGMRSAEEWVNDIACGIVECARDHNKCLIRAIQADALASTQPIVPTSSGNSMSQLNEQSSQANASRDALGGDINSASPPPTDEVPWRSPDGPCLICGNWHGNLQCPRLTPTSTLQGKQDDGLREALEKISVHYKTGLNECDMGEIAEVALAASPAAEWMPIESAIEGVKMMLGAYSDSKWYEVMGKSKRTNIPCGFRKYVTPTHWMNLPEAPK